MRRPASETREHVLGVAHDLFYGRGIRATGVDQVAAAAEVAPTTLYRLFASKDDLVGAYVARADQFARGWFDAAVAAAGPDPREQILAVFDALAVEVRSAEYRGCACLMTLAEYPDEGSAAHRNAVAAKLWVHGRFRQLAAAMAGAAPVADTGGLAGELTLVFEGVHATAQAMGPAGPAQLARGLAGKILDAAGDGAGITSPGG